jgi:hypothetical protein
VNSGILAFEVDFETQILEYSLFFSLLAGNSGPIGFIGSLRTQPGTPASPVSLPNKPNSPEFPGLRHANS